MRISGHLDRGGDDGQSAALIWCPFPDRVSARAAAETLLSEKLIACANLIPAVESIFEYEGTVSSSSEVAMVFKSITARLEQVVERLGEIHPHDTPAIVGWDCNATHPVTLNWLESTIDKV